MTSEGAPATRPAIELPDRDGQRGRERAGDECGGVERSLAAAG